MPIKMASRHYVTATADITACDGRVLYDQTVFNLKSHRIRTMTSNGLHFHRFRVVPNTIEDSVLNLICRLNLIKSLYFRCEETSGIIYPCWIVSYFRSGRSWPRMAIAQRIKGFLTGSQIAFFTVTFSARTGIDTWGPGRRHQSYLDHSRRDHAGNSRITSLCLFP